MDNKIEDLGYVLTKPCSLELLDMRTQSANLIYQYSLSLIYLKAVEDCLGKSARVEIQNSLNKGLYTEIKAEKPVNARQVQQIEHRMQELVKSDIPFVKEIVSREEAMAIFEEDGRKEKQRMLSESLDLKQLKFYSLEGCRDFFYGFMAPSTGYIQYFQLMKYRRGVLLRFPHPSAPDRMPPYVDEKKLYRAFGEQTKWDRLLDVNYVADLNEKIENGQYQELIQLSEALHEKKIAQIADMIKKQHKRIILIAGPSSSGKTTFARRLCIQLKVNGLNPMYLGTDDYFVEREDTPLDEHGERDYENLQALDIQLFNDNMNDLLAGRPGGPSDLRLYHRPQRVRQTADLHSQRPARRHRGYPRPQRGPDAVHSKRRKVQNIHQPPDPAEHRRPQQDSDHRRAHAAPHGPR